MNRLPNVRSLLLAVTLAAVPVFAGCAASHTMRSGTQVPGSEGTLQATEGANGNTDVTIWVKHLANPSQVQGDSNIYVVWFQPRNGVAQNVGAMTVDHNLEGRFDGSTAHRRFRVTVTPEPSGQVSAPTHDAVFTSEVNRAD